MSTSEKDIDLIDEYLNGRLGHIEKNELEGRLKNEHDLNELFQDMKLAYEAIRRKGMVSNFRRLQELEQSLPKVVVNEDTPHYENHIQKQPSLIRKLSVAAGFLLMLAAGGSYFLLNNSSSPEEIYQQYFYAYPNMETERGLVQMNNNKPRGSNNPEKNAFTFYDAQNYSAAIKAFKVLIKVDEKPKYYFFLSNAYMANNQLTEAIEILQTQRHTSSEYEIRMNWFLALAYLKTGETDAAKKMLQKITTSDAPSYKEKANAILDELK